MLITEGSLLKFDGLLLQRDSDEFALHASKFEKVIDRIFVESVYGKKYAGSEIQILFLRFLPTIPALEVSFMTRTARDLDVDAYDLTLMLRKHIAMHGFDGNSVESNSISFIENN
ncbi:unnamed protein product [Enterobius vermicularis]|uniref:Uncharacterized protein n=1 Tax=Enterobius vermicularis TaxID=51028 RepID=A0A0N4V4P1_ENTVE|nr:unnamed protein product [Enterobius vermicularis]